MGEVMEGTGLFLGKLGSQPPSRPSDAKCTQAPDCLLHLLGTGPGSAAPATRLRLGKLEGGTKAAQRPRLREPARGAPRQVSARRCGKMTSLAPERKS